MEKERLDNFLDDLDKEIRIRIKPLSIENMALLNMIACALENAVYHWMDQEKCEPLLKIWKSKTTSTIIAIRNSGIKSRLLQEADELLVEWMHEIDAMLNECGHSL